MGWDGMAWEEKGRDGMGKGWDAYIFKSRYIYTSKERREGVKIAEKSGDVKRKGGIVKN